MKHSEFVVGHRFSMSGQQYRCTDIGSRVVVAIRLNKADASWYTGPTYAVPELVIDEDSMPACRKAQ
jgi:hypothetical protein